MMYAERLSAATVCQFDRSQQARCGEYHFTFPLFEDDARVVAAVRGALGRGLDEPGFALNFKLATASLDFSCPGIFFLKRSKKLPLEELMSRADIIKSSCHLSYVSEDNSESEDSSEVLSEVTRLALRYINEAEHGAAAAV